MNAADTTWVLVSAGLVMFMTPGLALFYGGMIRARSMLNTVALTVACLGIVAVIWVAFGYSLAFGPDEDGMIGSLAQAGLHGITSQLTGAQGHRIPVAALASFQLMFAIITVALLAGAVAERTRFWPWLIFVALWVTVVYLPLAHWAFDPNGWFVAKLHLLDFAGGAGDHRLLGSAHAAHRRPPARVSRLARHPRRGTVRHRRARARGDRVRPRPLRPRPRLAPAPPRPRRPRSRRPCSVSRLSRHIRLAATHDREDFSFHVESSSYMGENSTSGENSS